MQVINYKQMDNAVTAGFVKHGFVVYGSVNAIEGHSKEQYLQALYEQCKSAIDYETALYEQGRPNSFTTEAVGEEFIPEPSKVTQLRLLAEPSYIQFTEGQDSATVELSVSAIDQYKEPIEVDVMLSTSVGTIAGNTLTISAPNVITEITVTATAAEILTNIGLAALPYIKPQIVDEPVDEDKIAIAEAIIDLETRLTTLEGRA